MSYGKKPTTGREQPNTKQNHITQQSDNNNAKEDPIQVNGFAQVLEMLKIADPEFRESLLRRLAARDRELARSLRADLGLS
jgi:hypothetical protein